MASVEIGADLTSALQEFDLDLFMLPCTLALHAFSLLNCWLIKMDILNLVSVDFSNKKLYLKLKG